jgi:hypothetical protein
MELPVQYHQIPRNERYLVRKAYIDLQEGLCSHCKEPLTGPAAYWIMDKDINLDLFPVGFLENPTHLHHCHQTGWTIGVVHSRCNAVLWQYHGE